MFISIMKKLRVLATCLIIENFNCNGHLQLQIFLHLKCYQMSYIDCIGHVVIYMIKKYMQFNLIKCPC